MREQGADRTKVLFRASRRPDPVETGVDCKTKRRINGEPAAPERSPCVEIGAEDTQGIHAAKKAAGYYTPEPPRPEDTPDSVGRPLEKY